MTREEVHGLLSKVPGMTEELTGRLFDAGFTDRQKLYDASVRDLEAVNGIDPTMANNIQSIVRKGALAGEAKAEEKPGAEAQAAAGKPAKGGVMGMINGILNAITGILKKVIATVKKLIGGLTGKKKEAAAPVAAGTKVSEAPPEPAAPAPPAASTPASPIPEKGPEPSPPGTAAPPVSTAPPPPFAVPSVPATPAPGHVVSEAAVGVLIRTFDITEADARALVAAGFTDVEKVRRADLISLAEVEGITLSTAKRIQSK